jgi:hypothetical protein
VIIGIGKDRAYSLSDALWVAGHHNRGQLPLVVAQIKNGKSKAAVFQQNFL